MQTRLLGRALAIAMTAALVWPLPAQAQDRYPAQPIRWIVPYAAGGSTDTLVRALSEPMQATLGQTLVVDNRPGGSTNIAAAALMQAKPDGYTLMHGENTSLFLNEHLLAKPQFRPETDFSYVAAIGRFPVLLVVAANLPAKTLAEFMAHVKARPQQLNYASPGNGTMQHITMELLKQQAGLDLTHVPYRGGLLAMQDIASGLVGAMMVEPTVAMQYIKSGRIRPLAVAGKRRLPSLPDVPTFAEKGLAEVEAYTLHGLLGPAGMPPEVCQRLADDLQRALKHPKVLAYLADSGFEPVGTSSKDFKDLARAQSAKWGKVIRAAGIRVE